SLTGPTSAPTPPPLPTAPPDATSPPVLLGEAPAQATLAPLGTAGGSGDQTPPATPVPDAPIVGEVRIAGGDIGSWLSIKQDGIEVLGKTLAPGQAFPFRAQRSILIKAGNAGVVSVIVNGKELCCADARNGEVRTISWPP